MATYEFRCPFGHEFEASFGMRENSKTAECPICKAEAKRDYSRMRPPGVKGHSRGPGSGNGQVHFERSDSLTEAMRTARNMEDNGVFRKNPVLLKQVKGQVDQLKNTPPEARKIDYDKGHPLDN